MVLVEVVEPHCGSVRGSAGKRSFILSGID
jgi:hypothetical protein